METINALRSTELPQIDGGFSQTPIVAAHDFGQIQTAPKLQPVAHAMHGERVAAG